MGGPNTATEISATPTISTGSNFFSVNALFQKATDEKKPVTILGDAYLCSKNGERKTMTTMKQQPYGELVLQKLV